MVTGLLEDGGGVLARCDRLLEPPHGSQGQAEVVRRHGLAVPVAGLAVDGVLAGGDGEPVIEPAPPGKVLGSRRGRRRAAWVPAGIGGHGDRGHQAGPAPHPAKPGHRRGQ